jgi:four helix bundle protein
LKDQIQRASVSIASNIAEWADRESDKEYMRFLYIARWSCSELKTQIIIAEKIYWIDITIIKQDIISIHKMLNALIRSIAKTNH